MCDKKQFYFIKYELQDLTCSELSYKYNLFNFIKYGLKDLTYSEMCHRFYFILLLY